MPFKTSDLSSNSDEHLNKVLAKYNKKVDFSSVLKAMKGEGSSQGFRELRDFLIKNYDALKTEFGSANIISLAISCDKHAIFADMAATKGKEDANKKWGWFQSYMEGKTQEYDVPDDEQEEEEDAKAEPVLPVSEQESGFGALSESV